MRWLMIALMLSGAAHAAYVPPAGSDLSQGNVTATGGGIPVPLNTLTGDILDIKSFSGIFADTKHQTCTLTISSGSSSLTATGCSFSTGDVGKYIVIEEAGTPFAYGAIASLSVTSAGSGYTSVPAVVLSNIGSGQYAVLQPLMTLVSASVASGGSGCSNGTQTFTLSGGTGTSASQVAGTVSGGVLSGTLTVVTSGSYSILPATSGVSTTGGGCSVHPSLTPAYGVGSIYNPVGATGTHYPLTGVTAAFSGGSPSSAATLGGPVVSATTPPLATTISGIVDATHITLAAPAGSSLAGSARWTTWGHDDSSGIQSAINSLTSGGRLYFPPGGYGILNQIETGTNAVPITIIGAGRDVSRLFALGSLNSVIHKNNNGFFQTQGRSISFLTVDGNYLATYTIEDGGDQGLYDWMGIYNGINAEFHSATGGGGIWMRDSVLETRAGNNFGPDAASVVPPYVIFVEGTDSHYQNLLLRNATNSYVFDTSAGNNFYAKLHSYGWAPNYHYNAASFAILENTESDGQTASGAINIGGSDVKIIGGIAQGGVPGTGIGVAISSGAKNCVVVGYDANFALNINKVSFTGGGTPDASCVVENNPGASFHTAGARTNGNYAFSVGSDNLADGAFSATIGGQFAFSRGQGSVILGGQSSTDHAATYQLVFPSGKTFSTLGDNEATIQSVSNSTVDGTTPIRLTSDFSNANSGNSVPIPASATMGIWARCVASDTSGNTGIYTIQGGVRNSAGGGSLSWIGGAPPTFSTLVSDIGASTYILSIALDNSNNAINLSGTGGPALYRCSVWSEEIIY